MSESRPPSTTREVSRVRDALTARVRDRLLTHVDANQARAIAPVVDRPGGGLVLVGATSVAVMTSLRDRGFAQPVLLDARRYAGNARSRGTARFNPRWLGWQRVGHCEVVLTDSGYVADGDVDALRSILSQTASLDHPAVAVLPLHRNWLRRDLSRLIDAINHHEVPVAVVMEHDNDPLSARVSVLGLTRLIRETEPDVAVLRCDTSALGALAFGAVTTAVGTRSGLRHLFPQRNGGGPADRTESAFLRPGLAFYKIGKLAQAVAADPDEPAWVCWCQQCNGRTLDWLAATATDVEVRSHSLELLLDLRDTLLACPGAADRQQSWRATCQSAEFYHQQIEASGLFWETPPAIRFWQEMSVDSDGRVRQKARVDGVFD